MTNDEFLSLPEESIFTEIDADHERVDTPAETALLHRTFPTYTEVLWASGYPRMKTIVITCPVVRLNETTTMPGVVRQIPVGWRDMASAEAFREKFQRTLAYYIEQGWVPKDVTVRDESAAN